MNFTRIRLAQKFVLANEKSAPKLAEFLGKYYWNVNGTQGGAPVGSVILKHSADKTGQYIPTSTILEEVKLHMKTNKDSIDLLIDEKSGEIVGAQSICQITTPITLEKMEYLFKNPISLQIVKDLGMFENFHGLPDGTKTVYGSYLVISQDLVGSGARVMKGFSDRIFERNPGTKLIFGFAACEASHKIGFKLDPNWQKFSEIDYAKFKMPGEEEYRVVLRKSLESCKK